MALSTKMGAMMAVYQPSLAASRPVSYTHLAGADTAINRKWWDFMADIMETNEDNPPVSVDLPVLFHMD